VGAPGDVEDEIAAQIRFVGRRQAEAVCFVRLEDVGSGAVGVGVDGGRWKMPSSRQARRIRRAISRPGWR